MRAALVGALAPVGCASSEKMGAAGTAGHGMAGGSAGNSATAGVSGSAGTGAAGSTSGSGSAGSTSSNDGGAGQTSPFADAGAAPDAARGEVPMFVAAGNRFRRLISCDDGMTWIGDQMDTSSLDDESTGTRGLGYGDGLFVAATGGGGKTARIFSSPDGLIWTLRVPISMYNGFSQVAYGNGFYVAGGGNVSIRSATGTDGWGELSSMGQGGILRHMAFGGGKFVAVGGGRLEQSADALTWAPPDSGTCAGEQVDVVFGNGHFLAANNNGVTCLSSDGGMTWTNGTVGGGIRGLVWTGQDFLARGDTKTYRSPDGAAWTSTATTGMGPDLMAVSDKGTFAGVAGNVFYRSTDGLAWTKINVPATSTSTFNRIVFGRGSRSSLCPGP